MRLFLLKLPLPGKCIRTTNSAPFGRTFGNAATVSMLEVMQAESQLITVLPMCYTVKFAIEKVQEGINIYRILQETVYFLTILFI
ncbi:hypothetical protein [Coxiella-like endosymbiont]|uniref:hypothetical protein n=1 Tax=Coxiella-like endosymbiont TaxID=1592897 RepID=UPI00272BA123|nr:hypothetical protein [Coxiella-like endosymbiont]